MTQYIMPLTVAQTVREGIIGLNPGHDFDVAVIVVPLTSPHGSKPFINTTIAAEVMPELLESICDTIVRREDIRYNVDPDKE